METMKKDALLIHINQTRADMGRKAAADIAECILRLLEYREQINIIFAAAPSQNEVLACLADDSRIPWQRINAFHMDEYIGISQGAPQSFANFLKAALFDRLPFRSVHLMDCTADPTAECARYAALLEQNPPDIVCMGIGENGHIAFNDPHVAHFNDSSMVKIVELDEKCRNQQVHDGCFASINDVPTCAMTLTIPTLLQAPYCFCVVPAPAKAQAVYDTVLGPVSKSCPASILRRKENSILYCDADSAALLPPKIRFGVIGVGNMGSTHANYLWNGEIDWAELNCVCDIDLQKLTRCAADKPGLACYQDYRQMLSSGKLDAVIIATPHYFHHEMAIAAFKQGLHVISEKPLGVRVQDVEEMNRAAIASGKVFSSMFCVRTDPWFRKIRELVQSGALGQIKRVNWIKTDWYRPQAYHDSSPWRSSWAGEGGGLIANQSPHNLDMLQWIFGMPQKLTAFVSFGKYYHIEVEDEVTTVLQYPGFTCTYIASTGEAPGTDRMEIIGDLGRLTFENQKLLFRKNEISEREFNRINTVPFAAPVSHEEQIPAPAGEMKHQHITQNFVNAILCGEELIAPGLDGINEVSLANAVYLSAWTEQTVTLPVDNALFNRLLQEKVEGSDNDEKHHRICRIPAWPHTQPLRSCQKPQ